MATSAKKMPVTAAEAKQMIASDFAKVYRLVFNPTVLKRMLKQSGVENVSSQAIESIQSTLIPYILSHLVRAATSSAINCRSGRVKVEDVVFASDVALKTKIFAMPDLQKRCTDMMSSSSKACYYLPRASFKKCVQTMVKASYAHLISDLKGTDVCNSIEVYTAFTKSHVEIKEGSSIARLVEAEKMKTAQGETPDISLKIGTSACQFAQAIIETILMHKFVEMRDNMFTERKPRKTLTVSDVDVAMASIAGMPVLDFFRVKSYHQKFLVPTKDPKVAKAVAAKQQKQKAKKVAEEPASTGFGSGEEAMPMVFSEPEPESEGTSFPDDSLEQFEVPSVTLDDGADVPLDGNLPMGEFGDGSSSDAATDPTKTFSMTPESE